MFGSCARYLLPGDTSSGDYLSSMEYQYVENMLYALSGDYYVTEIAEEVVDYDYGSETVTERVPVERRVMPYDEWECLIEEVFMEEDAETLFAKLDESFSGETSVYYNPDDDCIYLEKGLMGDMVTCRATDAYKDGTRYILTYDILDILDIEDKWMWTAEVTIEEADNIYGYRLISVEIIDEAEDVDWAR